MRGARLLTAPAAAGGSSAVDSVALHRIWAALLPDNVVVEVERYSGAAQPAGAAERMAVAGMQDARRVEFLSGRMCARKALAALGRPPAEIPIAPDRGPQWPDGIVGSITHTADETGGWVSAAVSAVATLGSLGIDMERCEEVDARALDSVLTPAERTFLLELPVNSRSRQASLIWCAKEAALKAARGISELVEVEIILSESGECFRATPRHARSQPSNRDSGFEGRTHCTEGFAFAAAYR
jgi:4'-phosphopantetheinyl transferase EntD